MDDKQLAQDVLDFMDKSYEQISKLESENAELIKKLAEAEAEKVRLEKVASESKDNKFTFAQDKLVKIANSLASKSLITKEAASELVDILNNDPNRALEVIEQLSGKLVPAEVVINGSGIPKEAGEVYNDDNDPDGWFEAIKPNRKY